MRRTPLARIASSTLNVAMVFCSRSLRGWSVPKRTSALAARWKTKSQPAIARVSASVSSSVALDEAESRAFGAPARGTRLAGREVVEADDLETHGRAGDRPGCCR